MSKIVGAIPDQVRLENSQDETANLRLHIHDAEPP